MNGALFTDLDHTEMFLTPQLIRIDSERGIITSASPGTRKHCASTPPSGECFCFPSTAPPIGVLRNIDIGEMEIRTRPGDFFVVYSDGVTEASDERGGLFGMERFVKILRSRNFASPADLVQTVLAEVRSFSGDRPLVDDLTLIAIGATPRESHLRIEAAMENLDPAVAFVRDAVLPYGAKIADDMELVASELVTNAIKHARPRTTAVQSSARDEGTARDDMDISLRLEPGRIVFDLVYPGPPFSPDTRARTLPDPFQEGGRGIHIVRALVDELEYSSVPMNHWHVVKRTPAEGST